MTDIDKGKLIEHLDAHIALPLYDIMTSGLEESARAGKKDALERLKDHVLDGVFDLELRDPAEGTAAHTASLTFDESALGPGYKMSRDELRLVDKRYRVYEHSKLPDDGHDHPDDHPDHAHAANTRDIEAGDPKAMAFTKVPGDWRPDTPDTPNHPGHDARDCEVDHSKTPDGRYTRGDGYQVVVKDGKEIFDDRRKSD